MWSNGAGIHALSYVRARVREVMYIYSPFLHFLQMKKMIEGYTSVISKDLWFDRFGAVDSKGRSIGTFGSLTDGKAVV